MYFLKTTLCRVENFLKIKVKFLFTNILFGYIWMRRYLELQKYGNVGKIMWPVSLTITIVYFILVEKCFGVLLTGDSFKDINLTLS